MSEYKNPIKIRFQKEYLVNEFEEIMCTEVAIRIFTKAFLVAPLEEFLVLNLNKNNEPILINTLNLVHAENNKLNIKDLLRLPISVNANSIQIARYLHSNDIEPTSFDIDLAQEIKTSLELVGIQCFDYLLIGCNNNWLSFVKSELM